MLEIKVAQNDFDLERLIEFCHTVHDPEQSLEDFDRMLRRNPFNPIHAHYFLELDGCIASMISLLPSHQYFGGQSLKVGQIALVGTHPDLRKQGLATHLMKEVLKKASTLNFPLIYLYGIPNFYEQFEFSFAIPSFHPRITISQERIENLPPAGQETYRSRKYRPSDLEAITQLYHQTYSENNCANIRSKEHWDYYLRHFGTSNNYGLKVILNMKGQLCGYFWHSFEPEGFLIREAVSLNQEVSHLILKESQFFLKKHQLDTLYIQIPHNHLFAKHCYRQGAAFYNGNHIYYGVWAGMYKILEIKTCINALLPQLSKRLSNSRFYDWKGTLHFQTNHEPWGLIIEDGQVFWNESTESPYIDFPLTDLNACFTGFIGLDEQPLHYPKSDTQALLATLFPTECPFLSEIDNIDELV